MVWSIGTGILLNMTDGGEGASGRISTEDTRLKLSNSTKAYYNSLSEDERQERKNKTKTPTTVGLIWSEDTKKKMSESQLGKIAINDGKKYIKIDKSLLDEYLSNGWARGKIKTDEKYINKDGNIKKISPDELALFIEDGWDVGRGPMTAERKDKIGKANSGKKLPPRSAEEKEKISIRLKEEWRSGKRVVTGMTNKKHTAESKQKISTSVSKRHMENKNGK